MMATMTSGLMFMTYCIKHENVGSTAAVSFIDISELYRRRSNARAPPAAHTPLAASGRPP